MGELPKSGFIFLLLMILFLMGFKGCDTEITVEGEVKSGDITSNNQQEKMTQTEIKEIKTEMEENLIKFKEILMKRYLIFPKTKYGEWENLIKYREFYRSIGNNLTEYTDLEIENLESKVFFQEMQTSGIYDRETEELVVYTPEESGRQGIEFHKRLYSYLDDLTNVERDGDYSTITIDYENYKINLCTKKERLQERKTTLYNILHDIKPNPSVYQERLKSLLTLDYTFRKYYLEFLDLQDYNYASGIRIDSIEFKELVPKELSKIDISLIEQMYRDLEAIGIKKPIKSEILMLESEPAAEGEVAVESDVAIEGSDQPEQRKTYFFEKNINFALTNMDIKEIKFEEEVVEEKSLEEVATEGSDQSDPTLSPEGVEAGSGEVSGTTEGDSATGIDVATGSDQSEPISPKVEEKQDYCTIISLNVNSAHQLNTQIEDVINAYRND